MPGMNDSEVTAESYWRDVDGGNNTQANTPSLAYDANGNLSNYNGRTYTYDAQNRLIRVEGNGVVALFYYDGKNRQIARSINGEVRFSVWNGWELIQEYDENRALTVSYLQGAHGVIKSWTSTNVVYYYQDRLGTTTHIADASGALLESYRYDLYGTPSFYDSAGNPRSPQASSYAVNDLYAGERWITELRLYDLRNRFMSPELGRFLQPDPIGFKGDASNLYRFCSNDPANKSDPTGQIGEIVSVRGNNVTITIPIRYSGPNDSAVSPNVIKRFNDGIHAALSGPAGKYNVNTVVVSAEGTRGNFVVVYSGEGYMKTEVGGPAAYWHANGTGWKGYDVGNQAGHEGLHFLRQKDHYTKTKSGPPIPHANWEKRLMGGGPGLRITEEDVNDIIASYQPSTFERVWNWVTKPFGPTGNLGNSPTTRWYSSGYSVSPGSVSGAALDVYQQTLMGIPGGGGLPGEGVHPAGPR